MKSELIFPWTMRLLAIILLLNLPLSIYSQYQLFADSYGLLSTIAGKGQMDNSSEISWLAEYENGAAENAELSRPHFAMADSFGNIYIADKEAHGIRKVSPDGKIKTVAGTNIAGYNGDGLGVECQLNSPNGLWVKADGTVYILDLGNNKIRRLDTEGKLETVVDDESGISLGRGIWITPSEDTIFYASASRIKMWTQATGVVTFSSGYGGLGCIALDRNGFLVATDRTANLVYRISKDGLTKEIIAGNGSASGGGDDSPATETGLDGVRGVWFLEDNSYFLATHEGSQIWYVDTSGKIHLFLDGKDGDEYHSGDGEKYNTPGYKISEPRGVSVDYEGNVIITENDYGFIRRIKNDYTYYYTSVVNTESADHGFLVFPNPARSETTIQYHLKKTGRITLRLYDISGKLMFTILDQDQNAGFQAIKINTDNLPGGVYHCSLSTQSTSHTEILILTK